MGKVNQACSADQVREYMEQNWKVKVIAMYEMRTGRIGYNSYRVVLPKKQVGMVNFDGWPEGIVVREWVWDDNDKQLAVPILRYGTNGTLELSNAEQTRYMSS